MITKPNSTILINEFEKIMNWEGVEVSSSLFTVQTEINYDATINSEDSLTISLGTGQTNTLTEGETVIITINDFPERNEIKIFGNNNKIKLLARLNVSSGSCKIKRELKRVVFGNIPVGKYYIKPSNEILIIRESWCNPWIDYSEIATHFTDFKNINDARFKKTNDAALSQVYSDLAGLENVYDAIWFEDIKALKISKMLAMASNQFQQIDTNKNFYEMYDKRLAAFNLKYKLQENSATGSVESDVPIKVNSARFGF